MTEGRVLVIGLDGATLDLVEPWAKGGGLPTLHSLMNRSCYGPLSSVMPVLSPSAWTSFMTGVNPGRHGIFDFVERSPDSYSTRLVHAGSIRQPTLWQLLSEQGKRSIVINVPMTYPPQPINGVLVSGLGTPDFRPFATPTNVLEQLKAAGYRVNKSVFFRPGGEQRFINAVNQITDLQASTALEMVKSKEWDFFMFVFRDTDEMAHYFWKHMDQNHPLHDSDRDLVFQNALFNYYQRVDKWLGRFIETAGENTHICVLSDHGMGPLYKDVYLNEWLKQEGYLSYRRDQPDRQAELLRKVGLTRTNVSRGLHAVGLGRLERWLRYILGSRIGAIPSDSRPELSSRVDWSSSRAYSFGYHGQLFINLQGREPEGTVSPSEYERLREEVSAKIASWVDPDDGEPVVTKLYYRERLFSGSAIEQAPDVVFLMRNLAYITRHGYELAREPGTVFSSPHTFESGSHREQGILCLGVAGQQYGRRMPTEAASIMDVAPTLLALMGCAIPAGLDGKVLEHWLAVPTAARYYNSSIQTGSQGKDGWAGADEDEVAERLRNLGYLR